VENRLDVCKDPDGEPALQGGKDRKPRFELLQENWAPAPRFLAGVFSIALLGYSLRRSGPFRLIAGSVGLVLLSRSLTNMDLKRLTGIAAGPRAVEIVKEIHVRAPVEEVFTFWTALENFPRFMSHVKEVRRISDRRYHWKVAGPAGIKFEWDADVTSLVPNQLLAWKSVEDASVENAGAVRFERRPDGGTRVNVRLWYNPPGGALGHAFAKLLGSDPKKQLDDDLLRFKSLIEVGKTTGSGGQVTVDEVRASSTEPGWPRS
jgi:uncharacterized membrane protein